MLQVWQQYMKSYITRSGRVKMAQFLGDAIGYESAFAPAVTFINKYGAGTYGNAMITKHKILEAETYPIPDPVERNEDTYYESRAVLRAVVEIEGKKFDVLVTHFGLATDEKINAVKTLVPLIKYAENPVILMGDFNILADNPILAPIHELLDDTFVAYPYDKESVVTCPSSAEFWPNDNYSKIDYIFVSRGIKIEKVEIPELVLSDHKPYIAYIEIPD